MYKQLNCKKCGESKIYDLTPYVDMYENYNVNEVRYMRCDKCMIFCSTEGCFEIVKKYDNGVFDSDCGNCKAEKRKYHTELGEIIKTLNTKYNEKIYYTHYGGLKLRKKHSHCPKSLE